MNENGAMCHDWEKAFMLQSRDAAIGKLFKGIIHNMNGEIQALSMQSELIAMVFSQVDDNLAKIINSGGSEETKAAIVSLRDILNRRSSLLPQMHQAVLSLKETVRRASAYGEVMAHSAKDDFSMNAVVRSEEKFLCADSFFKHKVVREIVLGEGMPPLHAHRVELEQVLFFLLANSLEALKKKSVPPWSLRIETRLEGAMTEVVVQDNGIGIAPEDQAHIFEPFFSTWGSCFGLGLYLAQKTVEELGGSIGFESVPGCTRFWLSLPTQRI